jgi:hypothetical protein
MLVRLIAASFAQFANALVPAFITVGESIRSMAKALRDLAPMLELDTVGAAPHPADVPPLFVVGARRRCRCGAILVRGQSVCDDCAKRI